MFFKKVLRIFSKKLPEEKVTVQCIVSELPNDNGVFILQFIGIYKRGSQGNIDADFIRDTIICKLESHLTRGLITDFKEMTYSWGNAILEPLSYMAGSEIPCVAIISSKCQNWPTEYIYTVDNITDAVDFIKPRISHR
ncbi:MAG: hypothetical protein J0L56_03700 [Chitinophagales bacterium]|nr:hypothetical protein [Chitinophagales bacterium]